MAGVGIEHDNYLGCLLVHAVVFAKGVHHPFPEGFGIAGVYTCLLYTSDAADD